MKTLKVWFPDGSMENQRDAGSVEQLLAALREEGVECSTDADPAAARGADVAFAGTWGYYEATAVVRKLFPSVPVVHYNWDLYPFQVNDRTDPRTDRTGRARPTPQATRWLEYVEELKSAAEVLCPSTGVVRRTEEFTGRSGRVCKCNVFLWEPPLNRARVWNPMRDGEYVMDVMREYTGEPMVGAVAEVCREIGVDCLAKEHKLSWSEFQAAVCGASLLVSAYTEASTGGLTLLEGYALGKDVLLSDSPFQGGGEYFGKRATYFDCRRGRSGLKNMIQFCLEAGRARSSKGVIADEVRSRRDWVERCYGVRPFARRLAKELRRVTRG